MIIVFYLNMLIYFCWINLVVYPISYIMQLEHKALFIPDLIYVTFVIPS